MPDAPLVDDDATTVVAPDARSTEELADSRERRLDPASIRVESVSSWIFTLIVFGVGCVAILVLLAADSARWIMSLVGGVLVVLTVVLVWVTLRWPRIQHERTSYVVSPTGLEIRRGVVWRSVINVPRSRIQHTDVLQGPLMRRYGLAALTIHTAGTDQASVTLGGLSHDTAMRLRDFLIRKEPEKGDRGRMIHGMVETAERGSPGDGV